MESTSSEKKTKQKKLFRVKQFKSIWAIFYTNRDVYPISMS